MIRVEGLRKTYGDLAAVDGLSFQVEPGQVLGLVGPNGAGKTTTLRCLVGIIPPGAGTIHVAGHDLLADPVGAKRELAFMPDEPQLFDYLTVEEHLRFMARLYQVDDAAERIDTLLAELELEAKRGALPDELSRGMKQKLVIACGLLHDPRVLVFDEPLTGLDPGAIRRMKGTILKRAEGGAAVILSSHLLQLVEELCSRVLIIQRGRAVAYGPLSEIRGQRPELEGRGLEDVFLALTETGGGGGRERRPPPRRRLPPAAGTLPGGAPLARWSTSWSCGPPATGPCASCAACASPATPWPCWWGWPTSTGSSP